MKTTKKHYITFNGADNMQSCVWEDKSMQLPYSITLHNLLSGEDITGTYNYSFYKDVTDAINTARRLVGLPFIPDHRSLQDQVYDLIALANKNKLYDAADYLTMMWSKEREYK